MAAIRFDLQVEMEDGDTYRVVADQRDLSRFEQTDFYNPRKHTLLRYLAWAAATRQGRITLDWVTFNAACVEVGDAAPEAEPLDPGRPDPRTGSSSRSSGDPAAG